LQSKRTYLVAASSPGAAGAHLRMFAGAALAAIALTYAARCLWLGLSLAQPMPLGDQWAFVLDYFRYLDGTYRFADLFAQHNEHRLVTTRLVLFADAIFFAMRGLFPVIVTYACLAATAAIGARLAARPAPSERFVCLALALGLLWSTSEWQDFAWQFEVQFALVHLFALVCLVATWRASERPRWIIVALLADALAVFSLGSGVVLIAPVLLLASWLRTWRTALVLAAVHAVLVVCYFIGYQRPAGTPPYPFDAMNFLYLAAQFIGLPFGRYEEAFGALGLILAAAVTAHVSWRAFARQACPACCVLAALALFVVLEGLIVAMARPWYDLGPRYAAMPVIFWGAIFGVIWRLTEGYRTRPLVPVMAVGAVIMMNAPPFAASWREQSAFLARAAAQTRAGTFDPHVMRRLCPLDFTEQAVRRLQALRLGPFAP
jgi:hypothetical protein